MNKEILSLVQIILGIIFIILVLLQAKGTGLGSAFGGEIAFYSTKRGIERILFSMTVAAASLLLIISVLGILL
ncbi:MAG: Preprotein translocase, SecG subunit [Candidatus Daviesbacteria bacterium GW2011_GWA1_41_61]|uniref:Protein-export membrane protein SecG n=1 Tax=Candidatus Daviesbacteria bacterium GW2011_GWA2_40_9 TaxID=1618424 RepID=A0A0G0U6T0_9BACT|nr:MAG: Preprotein translocase, SecG subunit [Candidatus Daviesbacteria bacterium GW2011_GWC1_40_9]KKR82911.1 MAG: Preprotein translocase, SecG subunit [Candidatus Daviesbacteria bacterium GW2011_GWA2_40_9]KKR92839.1 MAG: Preprotein translocase, SecG subunit [Candidatus Daviesbacteria bacterium GW2011_GWB1_41_15]KKS15383.1 MAG: Preprotein translocase, SecG subunit [Candidatus Daviesbacteria bacterium GW2011_GWA1_41_61]